MTKRNRVYSSYTKQSMSVFSDLIQVARKSMKWSEVELAERAGISRATVRKIEKGNPGTELGLYFEVATLLGVPLLNSDNAMKNASRELDLRLALLPKRVSSASIELFDDF
jgi:transcriptional regulator with XRE-family HTH domain